MPRQTKGHVEGDLLRQCCVDGLGFTAQFPRSNAAERIWQMQDIHGQFVALAFTLKSLNRLRCSLFACRQNRKPQPKNESSRRIAGNRMMLCLGWKVQAEAWLFRTTPKEPPPTKYVFGASSGCWGRGRFTRVRGKFAKPFQRETRHFESPALLSSASTTILKSKC